MHGRAALAASDCRRPPIELYRYVVGKEGMAHVRREREGEALSACMEGGKIQRRSIWNG
jgi:hypothetical protein